MEDGRRGGHLGFCLPLALASPPQRERDGTTATVNDNNNIITDKTITKKS